MNTRQVLKGLIYLGLINFIVFFLFCLIIGGDAPNGYIKDGIFYIKNHGKQIQVSETIWRLNYIQGNSLFITHPLMIISAVILKVKKMC